MGEVATTGYHLKLTLLLLFLSLHHSVTLAFPFGPIVQVTTTNSSITSTSAEMGSISGAQNLSSLSGVMFEIDRNEFGLLVDQNGTDYLNNMNNVTLNPNRTYYIFESVYPSTYSIPEIVIASVVVILLMIVVVVGNMLVIIAIVTEKALKNVQNWFIASLAVADFCLGIIVMPFSLANELMGYWIFGDWWCDIHAALDVLLCTASIMNLCLIALDRYWSITQAVDYLKKRTPARAIFMITFVWIFSAVICIPPLLGWKVKRLPERYPKCEVSVVTVNFHPIVYTHLLIKLKRYMTLMTL